VLRAPAPLTASALLDVNRALDSALGTALLEMHEVVLAPPPCPDPGPDPERVAFARSD
jgi:hypothetical protein